MTVVEVILLVTLCGAVVGAVKKYYLLFECLCQCLYMDVQYFIPALSVVNSKLLLAGVTSNVALNTALTVTV